MVQESVLYAFVYLCSCETENQTTYCFVLAIGGVYANASVVVGSCA